LNCENCGKSHSGEYGSGRFCSVSCARSFATKSKRKEINKKVSKKISSKKRFVEKTCPICKIIFVKEYKYRKQMTCSSKCARFWTYHKDNPNYVKNKKNVIEAGKKSVTSQKDKRRSKNEKMFYEKIKEVFHDSIHNEPIFNGWDADIIIPSEKIAILWNGIWHYKKITKKHSVEQVQNRDEIKINEIKKLGYKVYVIKDLGKHNAEFVNEQFNIFIKKFNIK
jgi:hypothetical protein